MNLPDIDILSAEELAEFKKDVKAVLNDPQASVDITYHSTGTKTTNDKTGDESEVGGVDDPIKALKTETDEKELEKLRVKKVTEALLIYVDDLTNEPKITDYVVIDGVPKYVKAFKKPAPGAFWKVFLGDEGN